MKNLFTLILAMLMALSITACGASKSGTQPQGTQATPPPAAEATPQPAAQATPTPEPVAKQTELIVFAAASMTETLEQIAGLYAQKEPNVKLVFNFDSSGTLKTQIQEGAECDLFISAGQKQMDQLDITASNTVNTEQLDFVMDTSRIDLLENRVVLVGPPNTPAKVDSFSGMAEALARGELFMAMGNSDVPVGQYTQKILEYFNLDEDELAAAGSITYGTNVKEVTTQVSENSVDCGVIYCTDAFSAKLDIIDYATAEMCGQVIYPASVLKTANSPNEAQNFLDYLTTDDAMAVFENVGFSRP